MNKSIQFSNGMSFQLLVEGNTFKGIGDVSYRGTSLRSSKLPWIFYTESEGDNQAVRFESFTLDKVVENKDEVSLVLRSQGLWMPRAQVADAMGEARVKSRRLQAPEAVFTWHFKAITEKLFENEWQGLSMGIEYEGHGSPIHWMMEVATWEIGSKAEGQVLIQQDVSSIQFEEEVKKDSAFSTIEKFFTDGWGGSFPMDMLPRAAGSCICDFQAGGKTALCLFSEKPGLTRSRLDKFSDEDVIHYLDRAYFPLGEKVKVQERKLLVFQGEQVLKRHETRNLWLDCFTEVRRRIHENYRFELEIPEPCSGGHLWDKDLKQRMEKWADDLERDLPEYARLGYKQAFIHGVWNSITSDPNPPADGNICCPYDFRFAEVFGGAKRMKKLNDTAQENGLRLMQWFSFHLSKFAPMWKEHPDWVIQEANGDPWDGNYGSLWSGRIRSGFGKQFTKEILEVMDDTGIEGIFWDSYQNLGVTCVDWGSADKAPQADEIFLMQGELQRKGFKQRPEVITIFGVSAVAIFGFKNDKFRRRLWDDFVKGDHAFALLDCSPAFFTGGESHIGKDKLSPECYFWLAAHRVVPGISADPWLLGGAKSRLPGGEMAEDYAKVNHLYNRVVPFMDRLRLQEDAKHVVWLDAKGKPSVIWVFEDVAAPVGGGLTDLESGKKAGNELKAGKVYVYDSVLNAPIEAVKTAPAREVEALR